MNNLQGERKGDSVERERKKEKKRYLLFDK